MNTAMTYMYWAEASQVFDDFPARLHKMCQALQHGRETPFWPYAQIALFASFCPPLETGMWQGPLGGKPFGGKCTNARRLYRTPVSTIETGGHKIVAFKSG